MSPEDFRHSSLKMSPSGTVMTTRIPFGRAESIHFVSFQHHDHAGTAVSFFRPAETVPRGLQESYLTGSVM